MDRHIRLDGCVNFRDVGGYVIPAARAAGPGTGIRWRKLFRSDALNELTEADVALLTGDLRVTTVVDLRTGFERQRDARRPLDRAGAQVVHASLLTERNVSSVEEPGLTLSERYVRMLELAGEPLVRAISAVADAQGGAVVQCAAGKDRTGLIIAAILGALGVGDDDIVADYALTTGNLSRIEQRLQQDAQVHGYIPGKVMAAPAAAMREVLAALRGRYGSMRGFLDHAGVGAAVVGRLHSALVVPLDDMLGGGGDGAFP
ncbi:MAG: tyrosine-protein phosphatase [Micromonosporaceae bacterium]